MLCERCGERPASIHVSRTVNGVTSEQNLCDVCAQDSGDLKLMFDSNFGIHQLLSGFLQQTLPGGAQAAPVADPRCPHCGTTYSQFAKSSLLGCSHCYEHMAVQLEPVIRRVQGTTANTGKAPKRSSAGAATRARTELAQAKTELQQAIAAEEYEKAARVRDRIRELERQAGGEADAVE